MKVAMEKMKPLLFAHFFIVVVLTTTESFTTRFTERETSQVSEFNMTIAPNQTNTVTSKPTTNTSLDSPSTTTPFAGNSTQNNPNSTTTSFLSQESTALTKSTAQESTTRSQTAQSISFTSPTTNGTSVTNTEASNATSSTLTTQGTKITDIPSSTSHTRPQESTTRFSHTTAHQTSQGFGLNYSEKTMTIFFSFVLGVFVLAILMYTFNRCKQKQTQYAHQPLYNSEENVNQFVAADDTLVISGGLYDGLRIYNPTVTTTNEDLISDQQPFGTLHPQLRLEFLNEEGERSPSYEASSFQTFQPFDENS